MPSDNTAGVETIDALALLALPSLDKLTDEQTKGRACVRDGVPLLPGQPVDLGERMSELSGSSSPMRWFPRACRTCVHGLAYSTLLDHAPSCEQCVDNAAGCETGAALHRLMREYRR
ncbi:hypothetical protein [Streptomyces sp. NPDC005799]|uniref:hypothetical protein n=1 Tax=Streptomyces sp. NPDC005799 TaxID=3154678 RepID=UPI0033C30965